MEKNSKVSTKTFSITISNECWKKIKILSIQKEISFSEQVVIMLERSALGKKVEIVEEN